MKKLIIIILILLWALPCWSITYYVDSSCTTGGTGTSQTCDAADGPFKTIAAAQAAVTGDQHGNSLLFKRGGLWREQFTIGGNGTAAGQFTIGAYGTGLKPKIYGSTQVSTWSDEGSNIWYATCIADPQSVWFLNTDGTIIWGKEEATKGAVGTEYDWWWDDPNDRLYVYATSDPDSRYTSIEKPTRTYGIFLNEKNYVTIQNIECAFAYKASDFDGYGIFTWGQTNNLIVEYCDLHHNGSLNTGAATGTGNGIMMYNSNSSIIRYNNTYENARRGICLFSDQGGMTANNCIIEHNIVYNNHHAQIDVFGGGTGSNTLDNPIVRYNKMYLDSAYGTAGQGLMEAHGIYFAGESASHVTNVHAYYNVIYNMYNTSALQIGPYVDTSEIYNNTIYGYTAGATEGAGIYIADATGTGVTVKNNISSGTYNIGFYVGAIASLTAVDNNLWFSASANGYVYITAINYHSDDQATYQARLAGAGVGGAEANGKWEDPLFVNASGGNFRLQSASGIVLNSTGSTFNRGDFTATNAFFWSSLDLSPYHGTDLASTPYYIEVLDGAGKKATGYIGAVGAGETLGSELITGWTNWSGEQGYETFTSSGTDITSAIETGTYGLAGTNNTYKISGELLKFVYNMTLNSGHLPKAYYNETGVDWGWLLAGLNTLYKTGGGAGTLGNLQFFINEASNYSSVNSLKQVTDPPSTAVHIVSSLNGTVRNWATKESGFNPNTIASWAIYMSTSPAKDAGTPVGLSQDYLGHKVPLGAGVDMGAYEYGVGIEHKGVSGKGYTLK